MFWECPELPKACETFPNGLPKQAAGDELLGPFSIQYLNKRADYYRTWLEIWVAFSGGALTRPEDNFPAISGVAERMARLLNDEYVTGFFRKSLPLALMWEARDVAATRPEGAYRAPTWSWASMDGPINPLYTQPDTIELSTIEHLEIQLVIHAINLVRLNSHQ